MNAYEKLLEYLEKEEQIEALVIGAPEDNGGLWPITGRVPESLMNIPISLNTAKPYLEAWSYENHEELEHPMYIWTNKRVIFVYGCKD